MSVWTTLAIRKLTASPRYWTFGIFTLLAGLSYSNNFILDDGFISLRYAQHWAMGYGPVWFPGSDEFGYTNFLYMAFSAGLIAIGVAPIAAASVIGYTAFFGSILLVFNIVFRFTKDALVTNLCLLAIFTNYIVSSFANALMETSLQLFFVLITYDCAFRYRERPNVVRAFVTAVAGSVAILVRLDSSLLLLPLGFYVLGNVRSAKEVVVFIIAPTVILGGFLAWCALFYESLVPSTFYAKSGGLELLFGLLYIYTFLGNELYVYAIFGAAVSSSIEPIRRIEIFEPQLMVFVFSAALWVGYIIFIGGDFMAFRFMVPVIAFFYIAAYSLLAKLAPKRIILALTAYALLANSAHAYLAYQNSVPYSRGNGIESPKMLNSTVAGEEENWRIIGERLRDLFYSGQSLDPLIAVTAAGAISFYSRLPVVDMHGLNDRWIAKHGERFSTKPGHYRIAPVSYLVDRGVNLIIGHPRMDCGEPENAAENSIFYRYGKLSVLRIPISKRCKLMALYLRRHESVDRLIEQGIISLSPSIIRD